MREIIGSVAGAFMQVGENDDGLFIGPESQQWSLFAWLGSDGAIEFAQGRMYFVFLGRRRKTSRHPGDWLGQQFFRGALDKAHDC
jgi:hypothetical protein